MSLGDIANFEVGGALASAMQRFHRHSPRMFRAAECSPANSARADGRYRLEIESPIAHGPEAPSVSPAALRSPQPTSDTIEQDVSPWTKPPSPPEPPSAVDRAEAASLVAGPSQSRRDPVDPGHGAGRARLDVDAGRRAS